MSYRLTDREVKALEAAEFECGLLQGDFVIKAKLGPNIGKKTVDNLVSIGLLELGFSTHHNEGDCIRITKDGLRCLYGGLIWEEIHEQIKEGQQYHPPLQKHWPVIEQGRFI